MASMLKNWTKLLGHAAGVVSLGVIAPSEGGAGHIFRVGHWVRCRPEKGGNSQNHYIIHRMIILIITIHQKYIQYTIIVA